MHGNDRIYGIAVFLLALCLIPAGAMALDTQLDRPNIGPTGTFNIFGARPVETKHAAFGLFTDFTQDPLEFHNFNTGSQARSVVDYMISTDFLAEVGLNRLLSVGIDLPLRGVKDMNSSYFGLGDISGYAKFAILHPDSFPVGISVMPFVSAPTANESHFIGDRGADLGGRLIIDKEFNGGYIGMNAGYKHRMKKDTVTITGSTSSLNVGDEFLYGIGGGIDILRDRLQFMAEFMGSTVTNDFAKDEKTSPMQANGGLKISFLNKQLNAFVGGGAGVNGGYGAPQYRIFGGFSASFPKPAVTKSGEVEERIETIVLQGVYFLTNSVELTSDSKDILNENLLELEKYSNVKFVVIGHTDIRASEEYNQKLSEKRAKSVMDYFIAKGIPKDRINSEGRGKTQPLVPNDSPNHWEKNRRVELLVIHEKTKS